MTVVQNTHVRVFTARSKRDQVIFDSSFAKWVPSGRVTPLGDFAATVTELRLVRFVLINQWLGYVLEEFSEQTLGQSIYRLDARTGRREHVLAAPGSEDDFATLSAGVSDLAETPAGTVAWIQGGSIASPGIYRVFEWPPGAKAAVLLATATDIAATSLAAVPGHLYWLEGGVPRGAHAE